MILPICSKKHNSLQKRFSELNIFIKYGKVVKKYEKNILQYKHIKVKFEIKKYQKIPIVLFLRYISNKLI